MSVSYTHLRLLFVIWMLFLVLPQGYSQEKKEAREARRAQSAASEDICRFPLKVLLPCFAGVYALNELACYLVWRTLGGSYTRWYAICIVIKKLEAGDRNIYREYIAFCNYKGKRHAMLLKRRKAGSAVCLSQNLLNLSQTPHDVLCLGCIQRRCGLFLIKARKTGRGRPVRGTQRARRQGDVFGGGTV